MDQRKFFAVLPRASRGLCWAWWALIVLRGALPGLFTVVVGAVVSGVGAGGAVTGPLVGLGAVFVAVQVLAPVHGR